MYFIKVLRFPDEIRFKIIKINKTRSFLSFSTFLFLHIIFVYKFSAHILKQKYSYNKIDRVIIIIFPIIPLKPVENQGLENLQRKHSLLS